MSEQAVEIDKSMPDSEEVVMESHTDVIETDNFYDDGNGMSVNQEENTDEG